MLVWCFLWLVRVQFLVVELVPLVLVQQVRLEELMKQKQAKPLVQNRRNRLVRRLGLAQSSTGSSQNSQYRFCRCRVLVRTICCWCRSCHSTKVFRRFQRPRQRRLGSRKQHRFCQRNRLVRFPPRVLTTYPIVFLLL